MELYPTTRTSGPPARRHSSNNGSRASSYSSNIYSGNTYSGNINSSNINSGNINSGNINSGNTYYDTNYVINCYSPKDRYSGSGCTVNRGNVPRNDNPKREYPSSISPTGSRHSTAANTSTLSKTDKMLTRGAKAADELRNFGDLLGEIPRWQAPASIMKISGARAKTFIVVCQKCKKAIGDWREARHRKYCNSEHCKRCT